MYGVVPPIRVGDKTVLDPVGAVNAYCRQHPKTLVRYDGIAGVVDSLTPELVSATRLVGSRISNAELRWLVRQSATAPWDLVGRSAELRDADPLVPGGLYDNAERLYRHFHVTHPRGVNHAKISKCLYLTRPGLFPILDTRLVAVYRRAARTAARTLVARPGRLPVRRAYWAAIHADLLHATDTLPMLRDWMRSSPSGSVVAEAEGRLSDLRLLDILAWHRHGQ